MNAEQLKVLLDHRFDLLAKLIAQSDQQTTCIEQNQLTDLMQVLSARQVLIEQLAEVTRQLNTAVNDDPGQRVWKSTKERESYRERQDHCDQMHQDLLAIEAKCESMLQQSRGQIEEQMLQLDRGHQAANRYQQNEYSAPPESRGGMLDLSE